MAKKRAKSEEPKKTVKSEEPKKKKPISLNILEIAKRIQKLEQTAGMPSEYPASQVMMSDDVTSVEDVLDSLTANSLGGTVTLNKNTDYVCTSDGYLRLYMPNSSPNFAYGYINEVLMVTLTTQATSGISYEGYFYNSVFVKKGMTIKYSGSTSTEGYFIPLS